MSRLRFGALLLASGAIACVRVPPQDLVSARAAYLRVNNGGASLASSGDMDAATRQLQLAEDSFVRSGDSERTRDEAYLALRKLEYAEVVARTRRDEATAPR